MEWMRSVFGREHTEMQTCEDWKKRLFFTFCQVARCDTGFSIKNTTEVKTKQFSRRAAVDAEKNRKDFGRR